MARVPESRAKTSEALRECAKPFFDHSVTGLKTESLVKPSSLEVVFPSLSCRNTRQTCSYTKVPHTTAKKIDEWSSSCQGCCLHCGDELRNAVPIAKFKVDGLYWVFGQFCGASCAYGYIREHDMKEQVMTWTRNMLSSVFKLKEERVCPPRFMLKRYGGPLDKPSFETLAFCTIKQPPLCTFAMFAEAAAAQQKSALMSGSTLFGPLERPTVRDSMPAQPTPTGKEPILLKVLAEATAQDDSIKPPSPKRVRGPKPSVSSATTNIKKTTTSKKSASLQMFMEEDS